MWSVRFVGIVWSWLSYLCLLLLWCGCVVVFWCVVYWLLWFCGWVNFWDWCFVFVIGSFVLVLVWLVMVVLLFLCWFVCIGLWCDVGFWLMLMELWWLCIWFLLYWFSVWGCWMSWVFCSCRFCGFVLWCCCWVGWWGVICWSVIVCVLGLYLLCWCWVLVLVCFCWWVCCIGSIFLLCDIVCVCYLLLGIVLVVIWVVLSGGWLVLVGILWCWLLWLCCCWLLFLKYVLGWVGLWIFIVCDIGWICGILVYRWVVFKLVLLMYCLRSYVECCCWNGWDRWIIMWW